MRCGRLFQPADRVNEKAGKFIGAEDVPKWLHKPSTHIGTRSMGQSPLPATVPKVGRDVAKTVAGLYDSVAGGSVVGDILHLRKVDDNVIILPTQTEGSVGVTARARCDIEPRGGTACNYGGDFLCGGTVRGERYQLVSYAEKKRERDIRVGDCGWSVA